MPATEAQLSKVTAGLPGGGETREGQLKMALLVGDAIQSQTTTLIEAGTGTGKSLAYLTPIIASGERAVIATATIALQSQLVEHDVPLVAAGLGRKVSVALLKGRGNYLCLQRLSELQRAARSEQLQLLGGRGPDKHLDDIIDWADETTTGDREELDPAPPSGVWSAVSVGSDECPGATRCPSGTECFSEQARLRAGEADLVVTNHHYYGLNLASGGVLLPEHSVVVFDEAHQLPEVLGATCGTELTGNRFRTLGRRVHSVLTEEALVLALDRSGVDLDDLLRPHVGTALDDLGDLVGVLVAGRDRADSIIAALRKLDPTKGSDVAARIERTSLVATRLVNDIDAILEAADTDVIWIDGRADQPVLRRTPLEMASLLETQLWPDRAVVLTSATLSDAIVPQLGIKHELDTPIERVGSPFDYQSLGLLYCPTDLPNPRDPSHREAVQSEILQLVEAAGGRTLCLFTSYGALTEAAERLSAELDLPVLVQGQASKQLLIERFKADPEAVLLATQSFWQGIDLPGSTLTLVTIDRIPFPRPDEPVTQARRDRAGRYAFREVDIPRAQTLLAQASGRLVRRADDRGVVAVLDPRLATNKSYRWELINAMPPFARTKDREEVKKFLASLNTSYGKDR